MSSLESSKTTSADAYGERSIILFCIVQAGARAHTLTSISGTPHSSTPTYPTEVVEIPTIEAPIIRLESPSRMYAIIPVVEMEELIKSSTDDKTKSKPTTPSSARVYGAYTGRAAVMPTGSPVCVTNTSLGDHVRCCVSTAARYLKTQSS